MQLLARHFGGKVIPAGKREYGHADLISRAPLGQFFC
jgi:GMP synthase (glutamine-hydrolysing)